VEFIYGEEGGQGAEGKRISGRVSLGYAAGMLYLMATAKTDSGNGEIDDSLWEKACEFWALFASGAGLDAKSPILALRSLLEKSSASGTKDRDNICGLIAKAWNAFIDGEELTPAKLKLKEKLNKETGKRFVEEEPRIGGLDVAREEDVDRVLSTAAIRPVKNMGWNTGDSAWFLDPDTQEPVLGTIAKFSKGFAKLTATFQIDGEDCEYTYSIPLESLSGDKPGEDED
jgi:hypothetical protein